MQNRGNVLCPFCEQVTPVSVLSTILCEILFLQNFEEGEILGDFSYRV